MFKWACFLVASVFLLAMLWLVNDVRLQIRRTSQTVLTTGQTINEHLPVIVEKTRKSTDTVADHLPEIVEKTEKTASTLADLAEDIRQLKELAGVNNNARDKNLVAFADTILDKIASSGGTVGLKKSLLGQGLKSTLSAQEWVVGARKEAIFLTVVAKSKKELLKRLTENKFGSPWYLEFESMAPLTMTDWLKENHIVAEEP